MSFRNSIERQTQRMTDFSLFCNLEFILGWSFDIEHCYNWDGLINIWDRRWKWTHSQGNRSDGDPGGVVCPNEGPPDPYY